MGGALDEPVVRAIADACRRERFVLRGVVPTVSVLGRALEDAAVVWQDGDVAAELTLRAGTLVEIRRLPTGSEVGGSAASPRAPLGALGKDSWRFADAYGAAMTADSEPIATRPGCVAPHDATRVPRWRIMLAAGACVLATVAALAAPGLAATRAARDAERTLRALGPAWTGAVRAERELRELTVALDEAGAFERSRRSPTAFLARLGDALPPAAQIVAVRLDSAGGNVVVLAERAGEVVSTIERMDEVESPQVIGPVTREYVGQQEKERATVRFRWRPVKREGGR